MVTTFHHDPVEIDSVIQTWRRESSRLRSLTKVVVGPTKTVIHDVNRDTLEFVGLTFGDPALERLLRELGSGLRCRPGQAGGSRGARGGVSPFCPLPLGLGTCQRLRGWAGSSPSPTKAHQCSATSA